MEAAVISKLSLMVSAICAILASLFSFSDAYNKRETGKQAVISSFAALIFVLVFFIVRGRLKQFFPFTDKVESFVTFYFFLIATALHNRKKLKPGEYTVLVLTGIAFVTVAFLFTDRIKYPGPYMRTIWYPAHVPLSFAAYALWITAGVKSLFNIVNKSAHSDFTSELNRYGFITFTLAMIFGGVWGYIAWGAYFLWDPKVLWSLILWIYYGNMLHIDNLPAFIKWKNPLYIAGMVLILITFVGTGFFTRSIHRF